MPPAAQLQLQLLPLNRTFSCSDASPGSQLVTERFHVDWNWYLCSQRSFIVAQIDGRGSGFQGELLRTQVHGKLGTVEVEDQLGVLT